MLNYIHADLHRIFRRTPRLVFVILVYAITLGVEMYQAVSRSYNSVNLLASAPTAFETVALILGIVEIQNVLADDFRAKTMQITIGLGVSRPKVVLTKLIDFMVLLLTDMLVLAVLFILGGLGCGIHLMADQVHLLMVTAIGDMVYMTIAAAITMIPVFYLQSTALAILFFLIISIDPVNMILSMLGNKEIVMNLHLQALPYSAVANTLTTQLSLRNAVPVPQLIGVIVYLVAAYALTVLVFKKRELEF